MQKQGQSPQISEEFAGGTDIDFVQPSIAGLFEGINDGLSNGVGRDRRFNTAVWLAGAEFGGFDLTVHYQMHYVNTLRMKFPGKRLSQHA